MLPELWSSYQQVISTMLAVLLVYIGAVVALRLAGRRTVAQMSAFDVVVTVAIGSTIASTVVPTNAAVSDGLAALGVLLLCQVVVAAVRQRFASTRRILDFEPLRVFSNGKWDLRRSPTSAQLTEDELFAMLRQKGIFDLGDVRVVVLEPTGKLSVASDDPPPDSAIMRPVRNT